MAKIQPVITPTMTYMNPEAAMRGFNSANAGVNALVNPAMAQVGQAGQEAAAKVGGLSQIMLMIWQGQWVRLVGLWENLPKA